MPKRFRDANGISHYASDGSIGKFDRVPRENGRGFGGRVAVDVERIPTKWQRSAIRKRYGKLMEVPEHQDLIRVDVGSPPKTIDPRAGQFEDPIHSPLLVRVDSEN